MNLFQAIALPVLSLLIALEFRGLWAHASSRGIRLLRIGVWLIAGLLIAQPLFTSQLAHMLGIGRGADLMLYLFMLVAPIAWFQLQTRQISLERKIVALARAEAIRGSALCQPTLED